MGMKVATQVTSPAAPKPSIKRKTKMVRAKLSTCDVRTRKHAVLAIADGKALEAAVFAREQVGGRAADDGAGAGKDARVELRFCEVHQNHTSCLGSEAVMPVMTFV